MAIAGVEEEPVEVVPVRDLRHWHQTALPERLDLPLDDPLLVGALLARRAIADIQVVEGTQGGKARVLDALERRQVFSTATLGLS
jgi:hypothetical protein